MRGALIKSLSAYDAFLAPVNRAKASKYRATTFSLPVATWTAGGYAETVFYEKRPSFFQSNYHKVLA
jgi:hypothetical protein